jgi:hypothetical protein
MDLSHKSSSIAQVLSPGSNLSHFQAEILQRQNFVAVLGIETVDSWQLDWDLLENPCIPFSNPKKISSMQTLNTKLQRKSTELPRGHAFDSLFFDFCILRARISTIHATRLEVLAENFFTNHFTGCSVRFSPKVGGMQQGIQADVTLSNAKVFKYYIKSHSGGRRVSHSSAPKCVDPRELFIYKVLEYLGVGCEAFFLHRSHQEVFIATLDAGHAEGSYFSLFQRAVDSQAESGDSSYGHTVWGSLHSLLIDNPNQFQAVESAIEFDDVAQTFLLHMTSLDIISRIFWLHDLLNNIGNFGFCTSLTEQPCLKILDFRVLDSVDLRINPDHVRGFLVGNGFYNYAASHATMRYALRDRPLKARVDTAVQLLTVARLSKLHDCIHRAHSFVLSYLSSPDFSGLDSAELSQIIGQLNEFCRISHLNTDCFTSELESWRPASELPVQSLCTAKQ